MPRSAPLPLRRALVAGVALAALACSRDDDAARAGGGGDVGGTVVIAQPEPDGLLPPLVQGVQAKMLTDLLYERLAELGPAMNTVGDAGFQPRLARRWTWAPDSLSIAFELDPRARWHDGRPVRAEDVRVAHQIIADSVVASPYAPNVANVDSVQVRDSLTAVVWFHERRPEQFFEFVYNVSPLPAHLLASVPRAQLATSEFVREPVGNGRWRFERWEPGQRLVLVADTASFLGRPKLDRLVFSTITEFAAGPTKLFAGEADVVDALRPENVTELAKHRELRLVRYPGLDYAFMQFNLRDRKKPAPHPVFGDRGTRRALTMALDRVQMVRSVFDSLAYPAIGPTTRVHGSADTTIAQLPFDTTRARQLLDSLGWKDANGDGVRERGGRPLRFTLLVPSTSKSRVAFAVLIQEQLRRVGARVDVEQLDFNAFLQREAQRDFDAVLGAWHTDPSYGNVRQTWGSAGANANGSNYGSYTSPAFDAAVDSALATYDPKTANRYMRRAYETIVADAPAVWLYEVRPAMGMHGRLRPVGIRADAWWVGLGDWSIPAGERIPRDRAGVTTTAAAQ